MNDESLIEPFSVQEIFVDGFTEYVARDGVMTCAGYRLTSDGDKVVKVRLIWPAVNTEAAVNGAMVALRAPPPDDKTISDPKRGCH